MGRTGEGRVFPCMGKAEWASDSREDHGLPSLELGSEGDHQLLEKMEK
jgi:hypothetical protein